MPIYKTLLFQFTTFDDSFNKCKNRIDALKSFILTENKLYYIGATNNPQRRLEEHTRDDNMNTMYVLCENINKNNTEKLEERLIQECASELCINKIAECRGITDNDNFIYILFP